MLLLLSVSTTVRPSIQDNIDTNLDNVNGTDGMSNFHVMKLITSVTTTIMIDVVATVVITIAIIIIITNWIITTATYVTMVASVILNMLKKQRNISQRRSNLLIFL